MAVTALLIWAVVKSSTGEKIQDLTFTQFINEVNKDNVHDVTIAGTDATGTLKQPKENGKFRTTIPSNYPELYKALLEKNVDVKQKDSSGSNWMTWVANALPMILLLGVWIFMVRQMQSGGNKALSFGKSRARLLSTQQKKVPCIIFIDEIDAVGRHRGAGLGGGHDEREQTLNALLVEMDGFESNEGVILIAATNRPDVLDPALLRPGRFDRRVVVPLPDVGGREGILKVHTKKIPLSEDVDISVLARGSPGFSGADLANLVNEAALLAARHNRKQVMMGDFESSKDKVLMGAERKSLILSEEEKKNTAFHEAGHALVAAMVPYADPLHKVTIIPRGMALGVTAYLPEGDRHTYTKDYLESRLAIMMGGRVAEELSLNHITTGAGNDIEQATELARHMVCEFGMSDLGPLAFGKNQQEIFLGRDLATQRDFSEDTAIKIDLEVKKFVMNAYQRAKDVLSSNRETLVRIAEALLVREVLDAADVKLIIEGKALPERVKPRISAPETTEVLKPQPAAPGLAGRERPQPA